MHSATRTLGQLKSGAAFFALLILTHFAQPARALVGKVSVALVGKDSFPILDSNLTVEGSGAFRRLQWLDDHRLIFTGMPVDEAIARIQKKDAAAPYRLRMYVWDTRTNEIRVHVEFGSRGGFCYNEMENWIRYSVPGKTNVVKEGKFGEEREVDGSSVEKRREQGVFYHRLTCSVLPYAPQDSGVGERRVFPLFRDHGVLDVFGHQGDSRPIRLFTHDYRRSLELALPRGAVAPSKIYYSKYKNSYVLTGFTAPPSFSNPWGAWPKGVSQPIYLLSSDGNLTVGGAIPWHKGYREALAAYFTTQGVAYVGGSPPKLGLFLVRNAAAVALISGPVDAAGDSPNGCKVAAAVSVEGGNKGGGVKVIDLCKGGKP
jgi:hypothetical protein